MGLWKKKVSATEMKTKLTIKLKKLEKREKILRSKEEKYRDAAKLSLKNGDERGYKSSARKYANYRGQLNSVSSMVETTEAILDIVEMQEGVKEIIEVGYDLKDYQKMLGLDPSEIEKAVTTIQESMERVNIQSETISASMEGLNAIEGARPLKKAGKRDVLIVMGAPPGWI